MNYVKHYTISLLLALTSLTHMAGCNPASPAGPVLDPTVDKADAPLVVDSENSHVSAAENLLPVPSKVPRPLPITDSENSDDLGEGIRRNEDGSTEVDIILVTYAEETRTRTVFDDSGESWEESYVVMIPVEQPHTVTVPAGVDVEQYLNEHYTPIDETAEPAQATDQGLPVPPGA